MNKSEEKLIETIKEALENGLPMIIMAEGKEDNAFAMMGTGPDLSLLATKAFRRNDKFFEVFDIAIKAYNDLNMVKDVDGFLDFLKEMIGFKPLDCDNCPVAESCEVKDEVHCMKEMPDSLKDVLSEMFKNPKDEKDG